MRVPKQGILCLFQLPAFSLVALGVGLHCPLSSSGLSEVSIHTASGSQDAGTEPWTCFKPNSRGRSNHVLDEQDLAVQGWK